MTIVVRGRGIAAITATWLLAERGFEVRLVGRVVDRDLILAVEPDTLGMIKSLFELQEQELPTAYKLEGRMVGDWHRPAELLATQSLSIKTADLTRAIEEKTRSRFGSLVTWSTECEPDSEEAFTFNAHVSDSTRAGQLSFGRRGAVMTELTVVGPNRFSRVERNELGWHFLLPTDSHTARLIVFAADQQITPQAAIDVGVRDSTFGHMIRSQGEPSPWIPVAPRLSHPLLCRQAIRIGEAALAVDPICGDGVGYAMRTAILATAAFADYRRGELRGMNYYCARVKRAFLAHLRGCENYFSDWTAHRWDDELLQTRRGIEYLGRSGTF